jgi:tetratricopeptide (TPR) repeat protein
VSDLPKLQALPAIEVWREMRLHMEWSDRLSLVFLFADSHAALTPIRQWADDAWQWRTAPMKLLTPSSAATAVVDVLGGLQNQLDTMPTVRAPVWVEMLAHSSEQDAWDEARGECLARLNEAREWLSRSFQRPLVICLPSAWLPQMGYRAPDLWHVRSYVASVASLPAELTLRAQFAPVDSSLDLASHKTLDAETQALARAEGAFSSLPSVPNQRALWNAKTHLAAAMLEAGQLSPARQTAQEALALMRDLRTKAGDSPQVLRDLSVSLVRVGDAESEAGRGEAALVAYRESLALSQELRRALGDSPQVLRDLLVSLSKVSDAERQAGRREAALVGYRESLALSRELRRAVGDSPQVLRDLSVSLERVGDAESEAGRGEAALVGYREGLALRRELRLRLGGSPEVLRDLLVSLSKVGDAESGAGRGEAALMAYRESLALSQELRQALGDNPQVLDDLATSLERFASNQSLNTKTRREAVAEAYALRQRLAAAHPTSNWHRERLQATQRIALGLAAQTLPDNA